MPRLRNQRTGVVVNVSDEKAAKLTAMFVPVEEAAGETPVKPKTRAKKSE